jgi:hypothetical protein
MWEAHMETEDTQKAIIPAENRALSPKRFAQTLHYTLAHLQKINRTNSINRPKKVIGRS